MQPCGKSSKNKMTYIALFIIAALTGYVLLSSVSKQKTTVVSSVIVIIGAVLIYFNLGNPDYTDQPYKTVQERKSALQSLSTDQLIAQYEANLHKNDTPQTRMALAVVLMRLQRFAQAEKHFKVAYDMSQGKTPAVIIFYAESKIAQNNGQVTSEAKSLIEQALKIDPENKKALYYKKLSEEDK